MDKFLDRDSDISRSRGWQSASIPLPQSHIHRTQSEIEMAQAETMAELREGIMHERIVTGMLRRCMEVGYHPKTGKILENIIQNKKRFGGTQDNIYPLFSNVNDDSWFSGEQTSEPCEVSLTQESSFPPLPKPEINLQLHPIEHFSLGHFRFGDELLSSRLCSSTHDFDSESSGSIFDMEF